MKKIRLALVSLIVVTLSVCGCRNKVIEDRAECDATICLRTQDNIQGISASGKSIYLRIFDSGMIGESSSVSPETLKEGVIVMRPKNSVMRWSAIANWPGDERYWKGGCLNVPNNEVFPKAYAGYRATEVTAEDYQLFDVSLTPLFSEIVVSVSGTNNADGEVEVVSDFGGLRDPEMEKIDGTYKYVTSFDGSIPLTVPNIRSNAVSLIFRYGGKSYHLSIGDVLHSMGVKFEEKKVSSIKITYIIMSSVEINKARIEYEELSFDCPINSAAF